MGMIRPRDTSGRLQRDGAVPSKHVPRRRSRTSKLGRRSATPPQRSPSRRERPELEVSWEDRYDPGRTSRRRVDPHSRPASDVSLLGGREVDARAAAASMAPDAICSITVHLGLE